jgi:heme oxygenase
MPVAISSTPPSVRRMLHSATVDLHAEVDARFAGSFAGNAAGYAGFLSALAAVMLPLERALEHASIHRILTDWDDRRRAALLLDDLQALDAVLPGEIVPPPVDGEARQLGIAYVLEGSRLGGKLLLRRALGHPDSRVRSATRYLSHGAGRDLWSSFLVRLETSSAVREAPAEAVAGAREAFALFGDRTVHG